MASETFAHGSVVKGPRALVDPVARAGAGARRAARVLACPVVAARRLAWCKDDPFGAEFVEVALGPGPLRASGVAVGSAPVPYRLDYEVETDQRFVSARFSATVRADGWSRTLELRRATSGHWRVAWSEAGDPDAAMPKPGGDAAPLTGALDVDLGLSPLFNTMPVLRHGLLRSRGSVDLVMAWVSVPDLQVLRSPQRYEFDRVVDDERSVVRFSSLAGDGFEAIITYDAAGFVLDYPGIARRLPFPPPS